MTKIALHWQILIALILASIVGVLCDANTQILGVSLLDILSFTGTLFINALKMIIVPLIMSSIITGMSGISGSKDLGKLGGKTLLFYAASSLIAILIGLLIVNLFQPGVINGEPAADIIGLAANTEATITRVEGRSVSDIVDVFLRMVPTNIVNAAAEGQMLGLIFFSILFGYFMMHIQAPLAESMKNLANGIFETMMNITLFIMKFAPIGVFALVSKTTITTGFEAFQPLLIFFTCVIVALAIHAFIAMPLIIYFVAKANPITHIKAMTPALLTAFSTASSSATLPLTMECMEKRVGTSNRTTSFVLPLGATVNMDGTALYECVAAMFIAQAYGIPLDIPTQFTIVLIALLTSIGVAGIPAASLVAITIILTAIGLPVEAIGLILVTDRVLDMCRTAVNVFSDSCAALTIAHSEGEKTLVAR